jgi:hypothetical protein
MAQDLVIERQACRVLLVGHRPSDDVTYKPGVDAHGRAVAPADLTPSAPVLAEEFVFDLRVDLAPRLPASSPLFLPQLSVGRVTAKPDGSIAFNGVALARPERVALAELCARRSR